MKQCEKFTNLTSTEAISSCPLESAAQRGQLPSASGTDMSTPHRQRDSTTGTK